MHYSASSLAAASVSSEHSHSRVRCVAKQPLPWQSNGVYRRSSCISDISCCWSMFTLVDASVRLNIIAWSTMQAWLQQHRFGRTSFAASAAAAADRRAWCSNSGIRQMMSSNDTSQRCAFLALMVSPMRSDFGGFCGRSTGGVSDYGAEGENRQRSTIRWLQCAVRYDDAAASSAAGRQMHTEARPIIAVIFDTHGRVGYLN